MKCEKCLYRNNCQFLATHKGVIVEGCDAFKSEDEIIAETIRKFVVYLKNHACSYDLDNYHWFEAVDVEFLDDFAEKFIKKI